MSPRLAAPGVLLLSVALLACGPDASGDTAASGGPPLPAPPPETSASGRERVGSPADVAPARALTAADSSFAALVERLSEPGGYFDTDNLISNETSYLHVIGALERLGVTGGAYIGVGPDQN
nr:hypothetical protein [Gemmatimonadota bacterium]NIR80234.1 hypothetical protein [Gemmatimonadota bacterium]NIT86509.1 hypothetical protein [Gemmatimonadota bacterium]NIU30368.1 hypothetical protein [Gemmatimonadota bacterium]NIU35250.1 hypothetical protein [Gemmatimonadota bacterium]